VLRSSDVRGPWPFTNASGTVGLLEDKAKLYQRCRWWELVAEVLDCGPRSRSTHDTALGHQCSDAYLRQWKFCRAFQTKSDFPRITSKLSAIGVSNVARQEEEAQADRPAYHSCALREEHASSAYVMC
jgi:predicted NAD/FAD-binding protein